MAKVYSLYWNNVSEKIVRGQRTVFDKFNIDLIQENRDGINHGAWINEVVEKSGEEDVIVISDIDAFPLNRSAYEKAVAFAEQGGIFGLAQFSNHTTSVDPYAGPMFIAFKKSIWVKLGSPDLSANEKYDAVEILSVLAKNNSVNIFMVRPTSCISVKWGIPNIGVFGIGTFYGDNEYFHLFESRANSSISVFSAVLEDLITDRYLDFNKYIKIYLSKESRLVSLIGEVKRLIYKIWGNCK